MTSLSHAFASPSDKFGEIRLEIAKLCAGFPGEYWRKLDEVRGYPTEFAPHHRPARRQ